MARTDDHAGIRQLASGAYQARLRYRGQDYRATWPTLAQARGWRQRTMRELKAGTYADQSVMDPDTGRPLAPTFAEYVAKWINERPLKPRTRHEYGRMVELHMQSFGPLRMDQVTREHVRVWHKGLETTDKRKAHLYRTLRAIFNSAIEDEIIEISPVRIKNAGRQLPRRKIDLPTVEQVGQMADLMPTPKYRVMILISAWCGLRPGELTELRRKDLTGPDGLPPVAIKVRRGVGRAGTETVVGTPKSHAGIRDVTIPPHIRADIADYLETLPKGQDQLLFPGTRSGTHMRPGSLHRAFRPAREAIGLPALRLYDLRHFHGTEMARRGATLADLKARMGHSSVDIVMVYQHSAQSRDAEIAAAMSANVIALRPTASE